MAQTKIVVEQLETESMQDYIKFMVFLELGASRTLAEAYQRYYEYDTSRKLSGSWKILAEKHHWADRVTAYDEVHLAAAKQAATPKAKTTKSTRS